MSASTEHGVTIGGAETFGNIVNYHPLGIAGPAPAGGTWSQAGSDMPEDQFLSNTPTRTRDA